MINKIILAIAENIKKNFEDTKIYTEEVKQGFEKPCFSIICNKIDNNLYRGQRYRLKADIEIHYYNDNNRENYNDVMLQLFDIINYVNVDNFPIRAVNMAMTITDDYYCFNVSYDFFYYMKNVEDEVKMMGEYTEKLNIL